MVMADRLKLAPGFRFSPTDQELITDYLKPMVLEGKLRYNFIETVDLYGPKSTPWQLFDVNDESWTDSPQVQLKERYLYVFTKLSKLSCSEISKGSTRENMRKKAGCGTWVGRTKRKLIKEKGMLIGEQRMLVFEINDVGDEFDIGKAGHYRMHEYSLSGVNKGLKSASGDDMVVCKITFSYSKEPIFKLKSKGQDDEGSECLTAENHLDVADFDDGSVECGWDASFVDGFMALLNSEEGAVEDISLLGKRKIQEESFCRSTKMRF